MIGRGRRWVGSGESGRDVGRGMRGEEGRGENLCHKMFNLRSPSRRRSLVDNTASNWDDGRVAAAVDINGCGGVGVAS